MLLRFTKMHGLGNDFVVVDALSQEVDLNAQQIRQLADRRLGIGCDQLLLIEPPLRPDIDFNYRIFNADGGEVEQCGNGARCLGKYISDKRLTGKRQIRVSTCNTDLRLNVIDASAVSVDMGKPLLAPEQIPFNAVQQHITYRLETQYGVSELGAVSMGNPHAVIVVDDIDTAPVDTVGAAIEQHPDFPERVNVGFMQVLSREAIKLRVFERGVGETHACGTGACAALVSGQLRGLLDSRVTVSLLGGDLDIEWGGGENTVTMTGSATKVFDGKIKL